MRLYDLVKSSPRRLVAPLLGYPGAHLTNSSLKQNEFNPALHAATISRVVERFAPDAVFFMMDLSLEAGALGLPVRYPLFESPTVEEHPVKQVSDLDKLRVVDPLEDARIRGYIRVMELMSRLISIPRAAYVTGPFTLAGLLMGASDIAMATITDPSLVHQVVQFCQDICTRYARALTEAGADIIVILEPTATFLSPQAFAEFCGAYVREVIASPGVAGNAVLHICGDTWHILREMCATGACALSLDSPVDFPTAASRVDPEVILIGNIDPVGVMVQQSPHDVACATRELLDSMTRYDNFVLSTGCDLPYETPHANIDAFMDEGRR